MRWTALVVLTLVAGSPARAEPKDAFSYEVVVPTPKESSLRVKKDVIFTRGDRGPLSRIHQCEREQPIPISRVSGRSPATAP
jgi:hypothetical protein